MGTQGRVLLLCIRTDLMLSLDVSIKSRQLVLSYNTFSCSKSSVISLQNHKSSFMVNLFLCTFSVQCDLHSFLKKLTFLKPWCQKTHFFLWLNRHSCANHLEPLEKMVLVYFRFLDHWATHIHHWTVRQHCWNSAFLGLEFGHR